MEQRTNQTGPEAWQIDPETWQVDPETFRRVWARVMPNEAGSPVAVDSPPNKGGAPRPPAGNAGGPRPPVGQNAGPKPPMGGGARPPANRPQPPRPPAVPTPPPSPPVQPREGEQEERLRRLMDLTQEGAAGGHLLAGRMGGRNKMMTGLAADYDRALLRLSALYFLLTGRRYRPDGSAPARGGTLDGALRDQYLWEQRWMKACREEGETSADPGVRDLCQELAREGKLHSRALRTLLEQSWKPPVR